MNDTRAFVYNIDTHARAHKRDRVNASCKAPRNISSVAGFIACGAYTVLIWAGIWMWHPIVYSLVEGNLQKVHIMTWK
jgi:hypothetical protein